MVWSSADVPAFYPDLTRALRTETRNELRLREKLAADPIVYFMRSLTCQGCGCPVVSCGCSDEQLPFTDPREVGE